MPDRTYRFEKTPDYWTGWILAYLQWRLGGSFEDLLHVVPFDALRNLYYPWHEASEERVARLVCDMAKKAPRQTKLALARKRIKKTQQDLAYESVYRSVQSKCTNSASETSTKLGNDSEGYCKSPTLQHRRPPRTSLRIQRNKRSVNQAHRRSLSLVSAPT